MQSESTKQRLSVSSVNLFRRMASTKRKGFILESKLVSEKKRRKSDLVVMWITLWDVFLFVASEIWLTVQSVLEVGKYFFNSEEVWQIREWLEKHLDQVPEDFSQSWRDGILLCKLLNKLQPGCYPEANRLDTNFGVRNFAKAFRILESSFDIEPKVTVEEIVTCSKDSESKLLDLLLQLKRKTDESKNSEEVKPATEEKENVQENGTAETKNCVAKGTGLMVGFVGRAASFGIFFSSLSDLNLVVEIKGPCNTICSERVTKRSPKKKNVIKPWRPLSPYAVVRSSSSEERETLTKDSNQDLPAETEKSFIPLEYEIHSNQISYTYFPLIEGEHRITILLHGQHVSDSPYLVNVEPSVKVPKIEKMAHIKSVLKPQRRCQKSEEEEPKKSAVRFQEPSERKERLGKILKRQVLRYIVKIDGKDVVVNTDSIDNLATSLLKMDYELQKRPLIRRNSWGFVGDAERKLSVIRQFGIDLDELEAQSIKMQRSNSLSLSPITKKPAKMSTSYECEDIVQQKILETVTEGRVSHFTNLSESHKDEDSFALINDEFYQISDAKFNGNAEERKDSNCIPFSDTGYKIPEKAFSKSNLVDEDLSPPTTQAQTLLKSIITDTKNLIGSNGVAEDNFSARNQNPFRFNEQMDEKSLTKKSEVQTSIHLPNKNEKSQITELSSNPFDYIPASTSNKEDTFLEVNKRITDVENSIEDFEDLKSTDNVFIQEIPCTKTEAKSVSNHNGNKNVFQLLNTSNQDISRHEKSKQQTGKRNLYSSREDSNAQTNEVNISHNDFQCKYSQKTTSCEGNSKYSFKSLAPTSEKLKHENKSVSEISCKSFYYSDIKKKKSKRKRLNKYEHLGQKFKRLQASSYSKKHSSSPKSLIENLLMKKLQSIVQNFDYEDISALSKIVPFKSAKNRSVSDPTCSSFRKRVTHKNLDYSPNENTRLETTYGNREEISNFNSKSRSRGEITVATNTSTNTIYTITSSKINTFSVNGNNTISTNANNTISSNDKNTISSNSNNLKNIIQNHSNNTINTNVTNNINSNRKNTILSIDNNTIDTSSFLSNTSCKINENERGIKFWPATSKADIEPRYIRKNFNIYHHPKCDSDFKNGSLTYELVSASTLDSASNHSYSNFVESSFKNSSESSPIKDLISKNTCQFTYKHFNPSFQFERENPIKNQIKLWETSMIQKNDKPISKYRDKLHALPELVDIKEKLKFWENAYHSKNEGLEKRETSTSSDDGFKRENRSDTPKSLSTGVILKENKENQNQVFSHQSSKEETNINYSKSLEKSVDSKMLNMDSTTAKQRSFSDPCVLDKPDNELEEDSLHLGHQNETVMAASSKDEMSSSNDGHFIELFADDEDSSMDLLCSTEDEYIDDEISENISTYWGDLSLMKSISAYDSSEYEEFLQLMTAESLQSCADECKFYGIATYFGHVAVKNRFWVLTKGAGRGNLSASVQGIGQHNVTLVSVEYTRKDIYEVTYQVFIPGLYLISVRWMDTPIPGSPYLCKVTF